MTSDESFIELTRHNPIFKRITQSEEIYYKINRRLLKVLITQAATNFIVCSGESEVRRKATEKVTAGVRASKYLDIKTNDDGVEVFKKDRPALEEAIDYFITNASAAFHDALEDLLLEATFKSLAKKTEKGTYILGLTEKEFFKRLMNARVKVQEERINARKVVGEKMIWIAEKIQALQEFCKEKEQMISEAKKDYKKCRSFKNWRETIKLKYPELPDEVIENLSSGGKDAQPRQLIFEYAAIHFGSSRSTIEGIIYGRKTPAGED